MRGKNFHYLIAALSAHIPTQTINNATVNGADIVEPWQTGRQVVFLVNGGAWPATTDFRARVQGKRRSDGVWETVKGKDGATDLEFTQAKLDDAGAGENGALLGTLYLNEVDSDVYSAVRLSLQNTVATAAVIGVTSFITDLQSHPPLVIVADELFAQQKSV